MPEKAVVYENAKAGTAYVVESKLKVMLEQDYLSLEKHEGIQSKQAQAQDTNQLGSQIVREIVIPELTKEVNENKNFVQLRQVYNSLILATWYKKKNKDSILEQVYADKNKVAGVNINDPNEKQKIYEQYLKAFKKGVYNYIKEDVDPATQEIIPRKYFSGGTTFNADVMNAAMRTTTDPLVIPKVKFDTAMIVQATINPFRRNRFSLAEAVTTMVNEHRNVFDVGELLRQSFTTYEPSKGKYLFTLRKVSDEEYPEAYLLNVFDKNAPQRMSIAQLYFSLSYVGRVKVAKLGSSHINDFAHNDYLTAVLKKQGFHSSDPDGYWQSSSLNGFWVRDEYRNKGVRDLWNLDRLLMATALTIAKRQGAECFLINSISDRVDYYQDKFGATPNHDLQSNIYNLRVDLNGQEEDPYIERREGRRGMEMFLVKDGSDLAMNVPVIDKARFLGSSDHIAIFPNKGGTRIEMRVQKKVILAPRILNLINRIKASVGAKDFAMNSDDKDHVNMVVDVYKPMGKVENYLSFIPWARYAARVMWAGTVVLAPIACYKFRSSPEALINLMDTVLLSVILALDLGDRQTKNFMKAHYYYLGVLHDYYEEGAFTNGHDSKEVIEFYKHFYTDFVDNLDDKQEVETLTLLAGTLIKDKENFLRNMGNSILEKRLELLLKKLTTRKEEFLRVHEARWNAFMEAVRSQEAIPKSVISKALQFYNKNDENFMIFLSKQQKEEVAQFIATNLSVAEKNGIKSLGPEQPTAIQKLMYWDLELLETAKETLPKTTSGEKAKEDQVVTRAIDEKGSQAPSIPKNPENRDQAMTASVQSSPAMAEPDENDKKIISQLMAGYSSEGAAPELMIPLIQKNLSGAGRNVTVEEARLKDVKKLKPGNILYISSIRGQTEFSPMPMIENLSKNLSVIHIKVEGREYYFIVGATYPTLVRMKDAAMTTVTVMPIHGSLYSSFQSAIEPHPDLKDNPFYNASLWNDPRFIPRIVSNYPGFNLKFEEFSKKNNEALAKALRDFSKEFGPVDRMQYFSFFFDPTRYDDNLLNVFVDEIAGNISWYMKSIERLYKPLLKEDEGSVSERRLSKEDVQIYLALLNTVVVRWREGNEPIVLELAPIPQKPTQVQVNTVAFKNAGKLSLKGNGIKEAEQSMPVKEKSLLERLGITPGQVSELHKLKPSQGPKLAQEEKPVQKTKPRPAAIPSRKEITVPKPVVKKADRTLGINQLLGLLLHNPIGLANKVAATMTGVGVSIDHVEAQRLGSTLLTVKSEASDANGGYSARVGTIIHFSDNKTITIRKDYQSNQMVVIANGWDENLDIVGRVRHGLGLDAAMVNGGIDLNNIKDSLQVQNQNDEIKFHMDPAMLQQLQNAPGFVPVIINIRPMTDLKAFLSNNSP